MRKMREVKFLCKPDVQEKRNLYAICPLLVIKIQVSHEWHFTEKNKFSINNQ